MAQMHELQRVQLSAIRLYDLLLPAPRDDEIVEALTWHVVVRYARCFTSGGGSRLQRSDVVALKDDDLLTLHDGLMKRRHETFAHAGAQCTFKLTVHLLPDEILILTPVVEGPGSIIEHEFAGAIIKLCERLGEYLNSRLTPAMRSAEEHIADRRSELMARLGENIGKHATPEQQAVSILRRFVLGSNGGEN